MAMGCGIAPTFPSRASGYLSIGAGEKGGASNDRIGRFLSSQPAPHLSERDTKIGRPR
jgi:hypothetical protein